MRATLREEAFDADVRLAHSDGIQSRMNPLATIGSTFLSFLTALGRLALFAGSAVGHCVRPPIYPRLIGRQFLEIGY